MQRESFEASWHDPQGQVTGAPLPPREYNTPHRYIMLIGWSAGLLVNARQGELQRLFARCLECDLFFFFFSFLSSTSVLDEVWSGLTWKQNRNPRLEISSSIWTGS